MKNNTVSRLPLAPAPRSRPFIWSALLALAAVVGPMLSTQAQTTTSVLPALVSYQGRVSTSTGNVGTGTPVNRTVTFRIWNSATSTLPADLVYAETQLVTISDGEFSVLIGQGTRLAPNVTIDSANVFGGATRYLGVTVDDGTAAADPEISPRQQLVSTAYAFRAKYAESLGSNGTSSLTTLDSGNVGIGNTTPPARLTVSAAGTGTGTPQFIITGADTNERLRFGVDETGNGTGYVQSFREATGAQPLLLNPSGGFVGINKTTAPAVALDVTGDITASGTLSAAQLSMSGRIMATALELWNGATANGLVRQGAPGAFVSSSSAATNDIVLQSAQKLHFVSGASGSAATMTLNGTAVNTSGAFTALGAVTGASFSTVGTLSFPVTGLSAPTATASGGVGSRLVLWPGSTTEVPYAIGMDGGTMWSSVPANGSYNWHIGTSPRMRMDGFGNLSLLPASNTASNTKAHLEVNSWLNPTLPAGATVYGGGVAQAVSGSKAVSIYAAQAVWAANGFIVASDARIKTVAGVSDGASDLRTLMKVEVTDYRYKDTFAKGAESQKKVIAQQVKTVFPQATSMHTDVVPDVYQAATIRDGWVTLATDLRKGERVKLVADGQEGIYEVLEVGAGQFRTDFKPKDGAIFVYGREVKDFLTVDYDAIAMLNVSATQQVKRDQDAAVKTLTAENAELRAQVAAQRRQLGEFASRAQSQETRLAAIERLVRTGGSATPRAASLKSGEVEE